MQKNTFLNNRFLVEQATVGMNDGTGKYTTQCTDYVFERKLEKALVKICSFGISDREKYEMLDKLTRNGTVESIVLFLIEDIKNIEQLRESINKKFKNHEE